MRIAFSPLISALMYFSIGGMFLYLAYQAIDDTVWNTVTIILTLIASLDIGVGIRLLSIHFKIKKLKK